jgi:hypothetical protein
MCLICLELQKQRMTSREARSAYNEMVAAMDPEHALEVDGLIDKLQTKELENAKNAATTLNEAVHSKCDRGPLQTT